MKAPSPATPTPVLYTTLDSVRAPCVVGLTWRLCDGQGELLDELLEPVDFLIGHEDLLPAIESALAEQSRNATLDLHLEPEQAFGDYQEDWVEWVERRHCAADVAEGDAMQLLPGTQQTAPDGQVWIVTEVYPEHVVLDANHPLAGMALQIQLKIHHIRTAQANELAARSAGTGFFRMRDFLTED